MDKSCIAPNCKNVAAAKRRVCHKHHKQKTTHGAFQPDTKPCGIPGCNKTTKKINAPYCNNHAIIVKKYSLSQTQVARLLSDPVCWICGARPVSTRAFAIDHDHACCSGQTSCGKCVRGILCTYCNVRLSVIESPEWVVAARAYLLSSKSLW